MRRVVIVMGCVALAVGGWVALVAQATRDNLRVDMPAIYAALGSTGAAEDCPDVRVAPDPRVVDAARTLRDLARTDPAFTVPNPDPAFGTLRAANARSLAESALRACVAGAPSPHPGWQRILALLR